MEGSDSGSIAEEEYTTALPAFSEKAIKEKKERGFRGVLPFQRKSKRKDKDKEKEKEKESRKEKERDKERDKENRKDKGKDKDRDDGSGERGGSALEARTDMGGMMSLRGKGVARTDERERDEEF